MHMAHWLFEFNQMTTDGGHQERHHPEINTSQNHQQRRSGKPL